MVSKKKYITSLENTIESQRVVINDILSKNDKLICNLNMFLKNNSNKTVKEKEKIVEDDGLYEGMPIKNYLTFGLRGIYGNKMTNKMFDVMGEFYINYFKDKDKMKNLLLMIGSSEKRADYFIDWLIENRKYLKYIPDDSFLKSSS